MKKLLACAMLCLLPFGCMASKDESGIKISRVNVESVIELIKAVDEVGGEIEMEMEFKPPAQLGWSPSAEGKLRLKVQNDPLHSDRYVIQPVN